MPMTRAERAARLTQLREQLAAINKEITQLEREDEQYVAYAGRAQAARQQVLPYADFARYATALEQLETAWAQSGRPRNWGQLPLLMRLREVLLSPSPAQPAAGAAAAAPAASPASGTPPVVSASPAPADSPPRWNPVQPAAATAPPAAPTAAPGAAATKPAAPVPTPAARQTPEPTHENLAEQHSPILNEVSELTRRAEEEFRLAQMPSGLASLDRAVYLLERVYHAPPAMVARLVRLMDDASRGQQMTDSDRARWELVRSRVTALAEPGA